MGWGDRAYGALTRRWSRLTLAATLRKLRKQHSFAEEPSWLGEPYLEIHGQLRIGRGFRLGSLPVQSHLVVHPGARLQIGDDVSIGFGCGVASHTQIVIGDRAQLGSYVMVLDSDYHVAGDPSARAVPEPIYIGRGVRIGSHVTVLRGSRIEDGARILPGSVVAGLVPRGVCVGGVPARESHERLEVTSAEGVSAGVLSLAQQTFRLPVRPKPTDGPEQIARWDSLGALSFLLALEASFGVNLNVDEAGRVRTLAEVAQLVQRSLGGPSRPDPRRQSGVRLASGIMERVDVEAAAKRRLG